jgi:hypothetical protein
MAADGHRSVNLTPVTPMSSTPSLLLSQCNDSHADGWCLPDKQNYEN